jgi:transposase-like protein
VPGKSRAVDAETKASAVADVVSGESVSATAAKYGVSRTAVAKWRDQAGLNTLHASPQNQRQQWVDLITDLTRANLDALSAISRHCQDPAWLGKQRAGELAILYGVQFDKLARLVAALAGDGPSESDGGRGAAGRPVGRLPSPP